MSGILTRTSCAQDDAEKTRAFRYYLKFNEQSYCYLVIQSNKVIAPFGQ